MEILFWQQHVANEVESFFWQKHDVANDMESLFWQQHDVVNDVESFFRQQHDVVNDVESFFRQHLDVVNDVESSFLQQHDVVNDVESFFCHYVVNDAAKEWVLGVSLVAKRELPEPEMGRDSAWLPTPEAWPSSASVNVSAAPCSPSSSQREPPSWPWDFLNLFTPGCINTTVELAASFKLGANSTLG